jgi:hypothetical protein
MSGDDLDLRVTALEAKINDERRQTHAVLEDFQQQLRRLRREMQSMNVRVANAAQRR